MKKKHLKKIKQFIKTVPVKKAHWYKKELTLIIKNENIKPLFIIFKNHLIWQYKTLVNITCSDHPEKDYQFSVTYDLLSSRFNDRLRVKTYTYGLTPLDSIQPVFHSAGWAESEIWDMFGVFFSGHSKLKRLLTDYGFEGYPLNKDYPLSGYEEIYYDHVTKSIKNRKLELAQEDGDLRPISPWVIPEGLSTEKK